uniref:LamG domain-containing protein n=1 Tax=uncultured Draconibacterium sp. TaxID=1573823 RepID=UPI003216C5D5
MRILLLTSALFFITFFTAEASNQIKREKYIDEVVFPTTLFSNHVSALLQEGYRAFVIDTSTHIEDSALAQIDKFLKKNPNQFIGFLQKGTNHYNGDFLYSYFINKMIDVDRNYLPLCDSLLKNGKQILFFSDRVEELKLASEDFLTYVELGKFFPRLDNLIFTHYESSNLFTVLNYNETLEVKRTDSLLFNSNLTDASVNYFKKTGKIPNFILTDTPSELLHIYSKFPFYVKVSIVNENGKPVKGVKFNGFEYLNSEGIVHLHSDKIVKDSTYIFRENIALTPLKYGYRFIPEIFTFNYNNYNQYKTIHAQRIDIKKDLKLHLPLSKRELYNQDYPMELIDSEIGFQTDDFRKKTASFNGKNGSIYITTGNVKEQEESFTIALWAKPLEVSGNFPFLSKAGSYCLKIREGKLCFTIVDINDLPSDDCLIIPNKWQHIALVYEKDKYISYYINGVLNDKIPAQNYKKSEKGFTIGTNQWDEYFNGEMSDILFWSRPLGEDELMDIYSNGITENKRGVLIPFYFYILALLVVFAFGRRRFLSKKKLYKPETHEFSNPEISVKLKRKNHIQCFGGFSIFDQDGINLAEKLSVKKRSFLMVVLYYTLQEDGISPQKLADIFWPGYNQQRAKNVRSTYIQEIRSVFSSNQLSIGYEHKKWKVKLDPAVSCDLSDLLSSAIIRNLQLNEYLLDDTELVDSFLSMVGKGKFSANLPTEYVDYIKQVIDDLVMDRLEGMLHYFSGNNNSKMLYRTIDTILKVDPVHEGAIKQKLSILLLQGNKYEAKKCFDKYIRSWEQYYGEPYSQKYDEYIHTLQQ